MGHRSNCCACHNPMICCACDDCGCDDNCRCMDCTCGFFDYIKNKRKNEEDDE